MPEGSPTPPDYSLYPGYVQKIRRVLIRWGKKNYRPFPWRTPAEPWEGLIAEILLQRTKADSVVPVYHNFIARFSTPEKLSRASVTSIEKVIYPLGLRWRAPLLKALGKELAHRNGEIPLDLDQLRTLPGVGTYVAAAWLGFHGGRRAFIVDANVVRLFCRLVAAPADGETRRKKWLISLADQLTPQKTWKVYNYAILDFTMQICRKKPACSLCPLNTLCPFPAEHIYE